MRGIVFLGNRKLELQSFPDPAPGPGEVVLEMKASGMCGSDLHPYRAVGNAAAASIRERSLRSTSCRTASVMMGLVMTARS